MSFNYEKSVVYSYIRSGILGIILFMGCVLLALLHREYGVALVIGPVLLLLSWKAGVLVYNLHSRIQKNDVFMILDAHQIHVSQNNGKMVSFHISEIECVHVEKDALFLYLNKDSQYYGYRGIMKVVQFIIPRSNDFYKNPLMCDLSKKEEIMNFLEKERVPIKKAELERNDALVMSRYLFVFIGIIFFFLLSTSFEMNIWQECIVLLGLILLQVVIHLACRVPIWENRLSIGMIARCTCLSACMAWYCKVAYSLQNLWNHTIVDEGISGKTIIYMGIIYVIVFIVSVPKNSIMQKVIYRNWKKRGEKYE